MRLLLFIIIFFIACKVDSELSFSAINDNMVYNFENSTTINEFINKADSLKCDGYRIVDNSVYIEEDKYVYVSRCKFPKEIKLIHYDGIELPIYYCDGFRKYGINLCENAAANFNKLEEFYLNSKSRENYPSNPKNATIKIVVAGSTTIEELIPTIKRVKSMRDKISNGKLSEFPFLFSLQSIQKDSIMIKPLKSVN